MRVPRVSGLRLARISAASAGHVAVLSRLGASPSRGCMHDEQKRGTKYGNAVNTFAVPKRRRYFPVPRPVRRCPACDRCSPQLDSIVTTASFPAASRFAQATASCLCPPGEYRPSRGRQSWVSGYAQRIYSRHEALCGTRREEQGLAEANVGAQAARVSSELGEARQIDDVRRVRFCPSITNRKMRRP